IEWIDLKEMDVWVKADGVDIFTENGEVVVEKERNKFIVSSIDFLSFQFFRVIRFIAWGMAIIGAIAVLIFIILTFVNYTRRNRLGAITDMADLIFYFSVLLIWAMLFYHLFLMLGGVFHLIKIGGLYNQVSHLYKMIDKNKNVM